MVMLTGWYDIAKVNQFDKYDNMLYIYIWYFFYFLASTVLWNIFATFWMITVMAGYAQYQKDQELTDEGPKDKDGLPAKTAGGVSDVTTPNIANGWQAKPQARDAVSRRKFTATLAAQMMKMNEIEKEKRAGRAQKPDRKPESSLLDLIPEERIPLNEQRDGVEVEIELGEVRGDERASDDGEVPRD